MKWLRLIAYFLTLGVLSACADKKGAELSSYKWKNRIILTYPASEKEWAQQLQAMRLVHEGINDRDLLILRIDKKLDQFSQTQREALIKKYRLRPGTHVLIGKDGTEKSRQKGPLNLDQYFKLIDTMPMRKKEMTR